MASIDNIFDTGSSTGATTTPVASSGPSLDNIFGNTNTKVAAPVKATIAPINPTPTIAPVKPVDTSSMFSKTMDFIKNTSSKVGSFFDTPENNNKTLSTNVNQNTLAELPSSIAENLPLGIGSIFKQIHNTEQSSPQDFNYLSGKDALNAVPGAILNTAQGFIKAPIQGATELPNLLSAGQYQPKIHFNIPGLGQVTNSDYRIAQAVSNGADPVSTVLAEKSSGLLDALFFAGIASKGFAPRTEVTAETNIPAEDYAKTSDSVRNISPKSFREYAPPTSAVPLTPEFIAKMQAQGSDLGAKFDPTRPTFFKMQYDASTQTFKGQVIQLKPSWFDTIKGVFNGDIAKAPPGAVISITAPKETSLTQINESAKSPVLIDPGHINSSAGSDILKQELNNHLQTHGPDVTAQALSDKLNIPLNTANGIVQKVQQDKTPTELAKSANDVMQKVAPTEMAKVVPAPESTKIEVGKTYGGDTVKEIFTNGAGTQSVVIESKTGRQSTGPLVDFQEKVRNLPQGKVQTVASTPTQLETSAKGKTLEEFLNSGDIVYHATPVDTASIIEKEGFKKSPITFFAKDEEAARILAGGDIPGNKVKILAVDVSRAKPTMDSKGNITVSDKNIGNVKTKSQLTDIWNKANPSVATPNNKVDGSKTLTLKSSEKLKKGEDIKINGEKKTPPPQLVSKTDVKNILSGLGEKSIDMNVLEKDGKKFMQYQDKNTNILIRPSALGLVEDNINVGDTVNINTNDLKPSGTGIRATDESGQITLASGFDPGLDKFLKEDVIPTAGSALTGFKNTMDGLVNVLAPTIGVPRDNLDTIMKMKGARDKQEYIFSKTNEIIRKNFDKMSEVENVAFIDNMKRGLPQATPALQAIADMLRDVDTNLWNEAKQYKPSLAWKENHYRVMWKTIPGMANELGFKGIFNRPIQGTKGFTKQSTLIDMSEGLAKGGVPISYNPIEMFQYAYADMNKYITAQKMIGGLKDTGQMKFVRKGKLPPTGFTRIDDTIAKVYMPVETANGKTIVLPTGEWYVESNTGRVLNNFLSKDYIRQSNIGRGMLAAKNLYTSIELAASPFHAVFESLETMGSSIGLGLQKLASGQIKGGLKDIATFPTSPYSTAKVGGDSIKFLTDPNFVNTKEGKEFVKNNPNASELLTDLFNGGGRMKMDDAYRINTTQAFKDNVNSGNYIGATLRALPALSKALTEPLFDVYIPRLKIGTFLKEYSNDIVENEKELSEGKATREELARKRWNFVEDRFGEMNFDNLFWNRTFKTSMQLLFRSVTWKLGNLRATGGATWGQGKEFYNATRQGRAPKLDPKMAWLIGMSVITAIIGTIMQKTMTGKNPQNLKDIVYPQIDEKGNRISTPTYWKDVFHLYNSPVSYIQSSMTGMISKVIEDWQGHDFYGIDITSPNDSFIKKAYENMVHLIPTPFSVSSTMSLNKSGADLSKQALSFFGFTKAPAYINQSDIQQKIFSMFKERLGGGSISQEDADTKNQKSAITKAYQSGNSILANKLLDQAVKDGTIKDANAFVKKADLPGDIRAFQALTASDQTTLIVGMSPDEIAKYAWYAKNDVMGKFSQISPNAEQFVKEVKDGTMKAPEYSKGLPVDNGSKPVYNAGEKAHNQGIIERTFNYAKAIGTDPVTAFHDIFHGQIIRNVTNGTVIVERMPLSESSKIKKGLGGDSTMELDHIIPLSIGGTNEVSNLQLVPLEKAKEADKLENELAKELKSGKITGSEARTQMKEFKDNQK
jgi:hypothetical protein